MRAIQQDDADSNAPAPALHRKQPESFSAEKPVSFSNRSVAAEHAELSAWQEHGWQNGGENRSQIYGPVLRHAPMETAPPTRTGAADFRSGTISMAGAGEEPETAGDSDDTADVTEAG